MGVARLVLGPLVVLLIVTGCGEPSPDTDTRGDSEPDAAMATAEVERQMRALTTRLRPRVEWRRMLPDGREECSITTIEGDPMPDDGSRVLTWEAQISEAEREEAVRALAGAFRAAAYEQLPSSDPQIVLNFNNSTMLGTWYIWRVGVSDEGLQLTGRTPCIR